MFRENLAKKFSVKVASMTVHRLYDSECGYIMVFYGLRKMQLFAYFRQKLYEIDAI